MCLTAADLMMLMLMQVMTRTAHEHESTLQLHDLHTAKMRQYVSRDAIAMHH